MSFTNAAEDIRRGLERADEIDRRDKVLMDVRVKRDEIHDGLPNDSIEHLIKDAEYALMCAPSRAEIVLAAAKCILAIEAKDRVKEGR